MDQRERILLKAHELYFRYGVRSITMDEIAAQCGISKKTIYQFFKDKDALVEAVMDKIINKTESECNANQQQSHNAIHEVFLGLDMVQEMFAAVNETVLFDLQKHHPKAYAQLEQHKSNFCFSLLKQNIKRGKKEELYRKDLHDDIIAKMRLEICFMPFDQNIFPKERYSLSLVEQELTEHFMYGIATDKGQRLIRKYKRERIKK